MIGAALLFSMGFAEAESEIVGRWSATGVTTATVEIAMNDQSQWVGVIAQCDTSDWVGKSLLTDFEQRSDQTMQPCTVQSTVYPKKFDWRISPTELEVVADFVVFEKRFV